MLSRKEQNKSAIHLPKQWQEEVQGLLNQVYQKNLAIIGKTFLAHGFTYPDEVVISITLLNPKDEFEIPVTYIMSCDLDENSKQEQIIDTLIDSIGVFYDNYFSTADWNDFNSRWSETQFKDQTFYYITNRENIAVSIQADILLNQ